MVDCAAILHSILLDVGAEVSDEYLQDIDSGHYWMSEDDAGEALNTNDSPDFDRRNAVLNAILENNGYGVFQ